MLNRRSAPARRGFICGSSDATGTAAWVPAIAALVLSSAACTSHGARHDRGRTPVNSATASARMATVRVVSDDSALKAYLRDRGLSPDTILARERGLYAVVASRAGADRALHLLRVGSASVAALRAPMPLDDFVPDTVAWFELQPSGGPAVLISFDAPEEGVVFSEILAMRNDTLARVFRDVNACTPATLKANDNGASVLVAFARDPMYSNDNGCAVGCIREVLDRFDVYPAWPTFLQWTGSGWRETTTDEQFYRDLSGKFAKAADWLEGAGDADVQCHYVVKPDTIRA